MNFNLNATIEEGIAIYEQKAQQAIASLQSKGFGNPTPPTINTQAGPMPYQGHIPPNLPELSDTELGYYMGLLTEWNSYVQDQLAQASVQFAKSKSILEHVEAKLRIHYQEDPESGKKRSNPERDDYMITDRRYIDSKSNVIYWDTLYTSIKAIANSAEQAFSAVSRRITQRGQEIDRNNRTGGTTGHTIPAGPMFGHRRQ